MEEDLEAIIIGGGACGLMCAVQAGYLGKKVVILEKNSKVGAKILISGGGRCNYANLNSSPKNFIGENFHFCKSAFAQFTVEDTIDFFESFGIIGQEKTLGQLFPLDNNAKSIVSLFETACKDLGVEIICDAEVVDIDLFSDGTNNFQVCYSVLNQVYRLKSKKVVLASGGLPIKKMGASDFALKIAKKFEIRVTEVAPALVPLTITGKEEEWYSRLSGNSIFCRVSNDFASFEENILFTHWGLSGPAILQISSYWRPGEKITINLLPNESILDFLQIEKQKNGKRLLLHILVELFPKKFVEALGIYLPLEKNLASLTKEDYENLDSLIHHFSVKPAGDKGYEKAEVMRGGVATEEISSKTMECKKIPGLFFGGECMDITGQLGGYNFQWAWSSAYVIAQNI